MAGETIAITVVEKIVDCLVDPIKRQLKYLFSYDDNIANLSSHVERLQDKIGELQPRVDAAERNREIIRVDVMRWLEKANIRKEKAERILRKNEKMGKGCFNRWCLQLKPRFLLSRKALKRAQVLEALLLDGEFTSIAHPNVPLGIVPTTSTGGSEVMQVRMKDKKKTHEVVGVQGYGKFEKASSSNAQHVPGTSGGLESRLSIMNDVMKALADDKIRMIKICGMAGIGKTTLVKEIEEKVKETGSTKPLFNEIVRVEFTEKPDVRSIQGHIAELLGLELKEDSLETRATRLYDRLSGKNKRILVILDNVWRSEDLVKVGIPLQHMGCRILLTSRREDVCADIRSQKTFRLGVLSDEEARLLFQDMVGESLYDNIDIAEKIVKKCAGLPIAISTVARALSGKSKITWKNLLRKLMRSDLQGEYAAVFAVLEVSYDFLQTEELKDFFLLCCLFPGGFDVPIEDLVRYGLGLKFFGKVGKVYEARDEAHVYVENLLNLNLLLSSDRKECVKMHDLVREFALSIASEGLFMARLGQGLTEWPEEDMYDNYTRISLQGDGMHSLPVGKKCPKLELLKLVGETHMSQFPVSFYRGMSGLKVLAFSRMFAPLLPASLQNLRTLSLNYCTFKEVMFHNLVNLEVLSLAHSFIEELPEEIKSLGRLRILDLTRCRELAMIPAGALGCLGRLEELYMRDTKLLFYNIEEKFRELSSLPNLVLIDMDIPRAELPVNFLLEKLEKFKISIGLIEQEKSRFEIDSEQVEYLFPNTLTVVADRIGQLEGKIKVLSQKAEIMRLQGNDKRNFLHEAEISDSFTEEMHLQGNGWKNFLNEAEISDSFNLKTLSLESWNELVCLIYTRCLEQKSVFPVLQSLYLSGLNSLEDIYHIQDQEEISTSGFTGMEARQPGWGPAQLPSFGNLRVLDVRNCNKLENIFSVSIARGLVMLEKIQIVQCGMMKEIFLMNRSTAVGCIEFPRLKHLLLDDLPSLVSFCDTADSVELPQLVHLQLERLPHLKTLASDHDNASSEHPFFNKKIAFTILEHLEIRGLNLKEFWSNELPDWYFQEVRKMRFFNCPELLAVFSSHFILRLNHLKELCVSECDSVEVVFDLNELIVGGEESEVVFINQLGALRLSSLPKMEHVCKNCPRGFEGFQSLAMLEVYKCGSLKYLFAPLIAKVLVSLRVLEIHDCELLEEVFSGKDEGADEDKTDDMIFFPMLDKLLLKRLPNLVCLGPTAYAFAKPSSRAPAVGSSETHNQRRDLATSAASEGLAQHQLPPWALGKPKYLELSECPKLVDVVSSNLIAAVPKLEEMKLEFLHNLMYIGTDEHGLALSFQNLKKLAIDHCDNLSYLFSSSTVKSLVQLRDLCVSGCMTMEVIVKEEDEAAEAARTNTHVFRCLQSIRLGGLPNLKGMCLGKYDFEWPSLGSLDIEECQEMMIFTSGYSSTPKLKKARINSLEYSMESDLNTILMCAQQKIRFTTSEDLKIVNTNLMNLKSDELPTQLFSKVRRMEVSQCDELVTLFSSHLTERLNRLQELEIFRCDSLEVLFDLEELIIGGEHKSVILNQLQVVRLSSLARMKHIWKNWPHGFQGFQSLTTLQVGECQSFGYLFSSLMAKDLVNLRLLDICGCEVMEMVVSNSDGDDEDQENRAEMIFFPKLHELALKNLPKIICFGPGPGPCASDNSPSPGAFGEGSMEKYHAGNVNSLFSFPSSSKKITLSSVEDSEYQVPDGCVYELKKMELSGCHKLFVVFSSHSVQRFGHLEKLDVTSCHLLEVVFDLDELIVEGEHKVSMLTRLDELHIYDLPMMTHVWKKAPQGFAGFQSLTRIVVHQCQSLSYLFSPSIAKVLVKLRLLHVSDCGVMNEVLSKIKEKGNDEEKVASMIFFPQLGDVKLHLLPNLQRINNGDFVFQGMLPGRTDFVSSGIHQEDSITSISSSNFSGKLDALTVPENSKSLVISDTSDGPNRTMDVSECHKLLYLFPARLMLQNFNKLLIRDCNALEEIFDVDEIYIDGGPVVTVSQLKELNLVSLPKLMHIWRNKHFHVLDFPHLKTIYINGTV